MPDLQGDHQARLATPHAGRRGGQQSALVRHVLRPSDAERRTEDNALARGASLVSVAVSHSFSHRYAADWEFDATVFL